MWQKRWRSASTSHWISSSGRPPAWRKPSLGWVRIPTLAITPVRRRRMDLKALKQFTDQTWDQSIVPTLETYIGIPNKSPNFDGDWQAHGHMDKAVELAGDWCRKQPI